MYFLRLGTLIVLGVLVPAFPVLHGMNNTSASIDAGSQPQGMKLAAEKPELLYTPENVHSRRQRVFIKENLKKLNLAAVSASLWKVSRYYFSSSKKPMACEVSGDLEFDCVAFTIDDLLARIEEIKRLRERDCSLSYALYHGIGPGLRIVQVDSDAIVASNKRELEWLQRKETIGFLDKIRRRLNIEEKEYKRTIPALLTRLIEVELQRLLKESPSDESYELAEISGGLASNGLVTIEGAKILEKKLDEIKCEIALVEKALISRAKRDGGFFFMVANAASEKKQYLVDLHEDNKQALLHSVAQSLVPLVRAARKLEEVLRENRGSVPAVSGGTMKYARSVDEVLLHSQRRREALLNAYLKTNRIGRNFFEQATRSSLSSDDLSGDPVEITFVHGDTVCAVCLAVDFLFEKELAVCGKEPTRHFMCKDCFVALCAQRCPATNERQCPFCRAPGMQVRPLIVGKKEVKVSVPTATSSSAKTNVQEDDDDDDDI